MWYFQITRETGLYCNQALSRGGIIWQWNWENLSLSLHLKRQRTCSEEVYKYHCGWNEKAKMHWQGLEGVGDDICFAIILSTKERIHFIQQIDSRCLGDSESLLKTSVNNFCEKGIKRKGTVQHQRDVSLGGRELCSTLLSSVSHSAFKTRNPILRNTTEVKLVLCVTV